MAFAQSMQKGQIPIGCQLCESGSKIEWKCIDCSLLMCTKCKDKVHSKFKNAADHKIIGIEEVGQFEESESLKFTDNKCQQHEGQDCCMFCMTCKLLICLKCIAKTHNGHEYMDEEEYRNERKKIREGLANAQKNLDELSDEEKELERLKRESNKEFTKVKAEIFNRKIAFKKAADQYSEKLINEVDQRKRNVTQSIDGRKNEVGRAKKLIEEQMSSTDEILNSNNFATFIQNFERTGTALQRKVISTSQPIISMPEFMPKEITQTTFGILQGGESKDSRNIQMEVLNCFTIDINHIHYIAISPDNSLWIGNGFTDKLYHVSIDNQGIKIISNLNSRVGGIATTSTKDLLLISRGHSRIQKIINGSLNLVDTQFSVDPLIITAVHVTKDDKLILGARGGDKPFPATGKRVVIVMDKDGNPTAEYGYDKTGKPIFTYCKYITCTADGKIGVTDWFNIEGHGRVVILNPQGEVINIYNGNHVINKEDPFSPLNIATTSLDNMILTDMLSQVLHIINCNGQPIAFYNTRDIGIQCAFSLAISSSTGHLYIGCNAKDEESQELYELEFKGF